MIITYKRVEGEGRWSFAWDGPALVHAIRDALVIVACAKYLGYF